MRGPGSAPAGRAERRARHRQDAAGSRARARGPWRWNGSVRRLPGGRARLLPAVRGGAAPLRARGSARGRSDPAARSLRGSSPSCRPAGRAAAVDDPETRRYLLFEAVSALLTDAARRAPVLLVLDDLHWADRPTLQLLRHVVRAPDQAPLLILGHIPARPRSPPTTRCPSCSPTCGADRLFDRVSLARPGPHSVGALISPAPATPVRARADGPRRDGGQPVLRRGGGAPPDRDRRCRRSAGAAGLKSAEIGVPEGVKEVLGRRLARLSDGCRAVLSQAAVLGREFRFDLLPAMSGIDDEAVIGALEEALEAQLVVEERARPSTRSRTRSCARRSTARSARRAASGCTRWPRSPSRPSSARRPTRRSPRWRCTTGSRVRRRPGQGHRVLAARRRARAPELRLGGGDGALGRRARADGARRRRPGRAHPPARRTVGPVGRRRRPGPPDRLPRAGACPGGRARRRRAGRAGALAAGHGPLADRLDLRRPHGHPAGVPPLRRRPRGARAGAGAQGARPPRDGRGDRADLWRADRAPGSRPAPARWRSPSSSATRRCGPAPPRLRLAQDRGAGELREGFDARRARASRRRPRAAAVPGLDGHRTSAVR